MSAGAVEVRAQVREQLASAIDALCSSDEAALHTLAGRLKAELADLAFQSGVDGVDE